PVFGRGNAVELRNRSDWSLRRAFRGDDQPWVSCVDFDATAVVAGFAHGTVRLWDAATGELAWTTENGLSAQRQSICLHRSKVVVTGYNAATKILDRTTGALVETIEDPLFVAAGSLDLCGDRFAYATTKAIKLRSLEPSAHVRDFGTGSIAVSYDGRRVASGSYDHTLHVWDANTAECLRVIKTSWASFTVSLHDTRLVCSNFLSVLVFDVDTGSMMHSFTIGDAPRKNNFLMTLKMDSTTIFCSEKFGVISVWDFGYGIPYASIF
ncbi:quinon protein alcohol dehydrogenase-like superfamily, partial [Zopfochytrium polystomum]